MKTQNFSFRPITRGVVAGLLLTAGVAFGQNTGWRRVSDPTNAPSADPSTPIAAPEAAAQPVDPPAPQVAAPYAGQPAGTVNGSQPPAPNAGPQSDPYSGIPSRLTIQPGTLLNVRINEGLSSDRNQVGDFFSGTLTDPVVVDGIVVAQRGQTVSGRVVDVARGGHLKGVAKLGVQLTTLTAVDGQQVPVQTQFTGQQGRSNAGRSVGTVAATTGVGAAVGAAADMGAGAAVGAGVGMMAGLAGVLLSHGSPAVLPPESLLTFRLETAAVVATDRAPLAFRYVDPNDYQQPQPPVQYSASGPAPAPPPYYVYASPYPYWGYPYPFWGPGIGVTIGPGFYGGGLYGGGLYGGGFYRGGFYRGGFRGYRGFRR